MYETKNRSGLIVTGLIIMSDKQFTSEGAVVIKTKNTEGVEILHVTQKKC